MSSDHTPSPRARVRHAVGVMTGTSIDGIDAALVRIEGSGLNMRAALVRHVSQPLGRLQQKLRAAASQQPMTAGEFAKLAWEFGELHAEVIEELLAIPLSPRERAGVRVATTSTRTRERSLPPSPPAPLPEGEEGDGGPDLICIHGQTVFHQPPISWQLGNPAPIAARFGCPVISDLRQTDLAHGGQGAPITPVADWVLFRDREGARTRAIINLGGFCNVTIVPPQRAEPSSAASHDSLGGILGFDVCACNQLLDALARAALGTPFDDNGAAAARGRAQPQAAESLRAILDRQRTAAAAANRRSLGTGDEALAWLDQWAARIAPNDLAASAVHAIAGTIADAIAKHRADDLVLAGGGARNLALRKLLAGAAPGRATTDTAALGVPIEAREAVCFAVLGALSQDGVPITLPQVTGCRAPAPVCGTWTTVRSSTA